MTTASYDPAYFALLYEIEDRHFWFRARNQVIASVAGRLAGDMGEHPRVLEVGCGTGNVLHELEALFRKGTVIGVDLFAEGLEFARMRTGSLLVQGDASALPFGTPFDLIGLFDVLEHLPDDLLVLRGLHGALSSNGRLLLTVPAHPCLWSYFDTVSHHCRRYRPRELECMLLRAGYQVEYVTQYMTTILPMVWMRRWATALTGCLSKSSRSADELAVRELGITAVLNDLMIFLLSFERAMIGRGKRLPIGTSLLVVASKASSRGA